MGMIDTKFVQRGWKLCHDIVDTRDVIYSKLYMRNGIYMVTSACSAGRDKKLSVVFAKVVHIFCLDCQSQAISTSGIW